MEKLSTYFLLIMKRARGVISLRSSRDDTTRFKLTSEDSNDFPSTLRSGVIMRSFGDRLPVWSRSQPAESPTQRPWRSAATKQFNFEETVVDQGICSHCLVKQPIALERQFGGSEERSHG